MLNQEKLKQRYEKFRGNFELKDFIGFSALIFGLLLSNNSGQTTESKNQVSEPVSIEQPQEETAIEKKPTIQPKQKKLSQKKSKKKPKS